MDLTSKLVLTSSESLKKCLKEELLITFLQRYLELGIKMAARERLSIFAERNKAKEPRL